MQTEKVAKSLLNGRFQKSSIPTQREIYQETEEKKSKWKEQKQNWSHKFYNTKIPIIIRGRGDLNKNALTLNNTNRESCKKFI